MPQNLPRGAAGAAAAAAWRVPWLRATAAAAAGALLVPASSSGGRAQKGGAQRVPGSGTCGSGTWLLVRSRRPHHHLLLRLFLLRRGSRPIGIGTAAGISGCAAERRRMAGGRRGSRGGRRQRPSQQL